MIHGAPVLVFQSYQQLVQIFSKLILISISLQCPRSHCDRRRNVAILQTSIPDFHAQSLTSHIQTKGLMKKIIQIYLESI